MDMIFCNHIEKNKKVYIDDMVVKSATIQQHATDLAESFFSIPKVQHETQSRKMCFWS